MPTVMEPGLVQFDRWAIWKNIDERKIPFQTNGEPASSTDDSHWGSYDAAMDAVKAHGATGLAFQLGHGVIGVDLDDCFIEGHLLGWAKEIVDKFASYTEISPSGNGLKIFFFGGDDTPRRKKVNITGGQGAIEMYSAGRYFTVTGQQYGPHSITRNQEAYDWLVKSYLYKREVAPTSYDEPIPRVNARPHEVHAYIQNAPAAISGQSGHTTTFNVACDLVRGFEIKDMNEAMYWMNEYNRKCEPPWSEAQLEHKIVQAMENSSRDEGYMLMPKATANLETFSRVSTKKQAKPGLNREVCKEVDGLLKHMMSFMETRARYYHPEIALSVSLVTLASLAGQKYRMDSTCPNLYMVNLAKSGSGKNQCIDPMVKLLHQLEMGRYLYTGKAASAQGIISLVRHQPSCAMVVDEFHGMLAALGDSQNHWRRDMAYVMAELFSKAGGVFQAPAIRNMEESPSIMNPALSLLGYCVPQGFTDAISEDMLSGGLMGRCLVYEVNEHYTKRNPKLDISAKPHQVLIEGLTYINNLVFQSSVDDPWGKPVDVKMRDEARSVLIDYCDTVRGKHNTDSTVQAELWCRAGEKATKLAMLRAISRDWQVPMCEVSDVQWAIKMSNTSIRYLLSLVEGSEKGLKGRIKSQISALAVKSIGHSLLLRTLQRYPRNQVKECIGELIEEGRLVQQPTGNTRGRKGKFYVSAE